MDTLWKQYSAIVTDAEHDILNYFAAGWHPTGGFDETGRSTFDAAIDLPRSVMRQYAFTRLPTALCPLMAYSVLIVIGIVLFDLCRCSAKTRGPLIPERLLYPFKFVYNVLQIFLCSYMSVEALVIAKREGLLGLECADFHFSRPAVGELLWLFYLSKIVDFMDTLFIVLSLKRSQFTFLHCFHHFTIYLVYWLNANVNFDGDIYFTVLANGFIHTIMYSYYWISMHIPKVQDAKTKRWKYGIWWKKYLTTMQLVQFLLMIGQAVWLLYGAQCTGSPPRVTQLYLGYIILMFAMFMAFYRRSYSKKKRKRD